MTATSPSSLLWVDDQIEGLGAYVRALEETGFSVSVASNGGDATSLAHEGEFNIILCDIWMPDINGIELLRQLRPIQPRATLGVLSSYLYLEQFRNELRVLDFAVQVIEKDMPAVQSPDFQERFIQPIQELRDQGVTETIGLQEAAARSGGDTQDPFRITLGEFMRKPILDKDRLASRAGAVARDLLDREFNAGKIWVLLCGSSRVVTASAKLPEDIPSEEKIMEFARTQQRAPFHFFRPVKVDDMDWSQCNDDNTLNYPTITVEFKTEKYDIHFDTGAPVSFFSYEDLLRLEVLRPTSMGFGTAWRGATEYKAVPLRIEVLLKCQVKSTTTTVRLVGQAVRDWVNGPFRRLCSEHCIHRDPDHSVQLCQGRRLGLTGRNLLTDNQLVVILDGRTRKTRVEQ